MRHQDADRVLRQAANNFPKPGLHNFRHFSMRRGFTQKPREMDTTNPYLG